MQIESPVQVTTIKLPDNTKESGLHTNIFTQSHTLADLGDFSL